MRNEIEARCWHLYVKFPHRRWTDKGNFITILAQLMLQPAEQMQAHFGVWCSFKLWWHKLKLGSCEVDFLQKGDLRGMYVGIVTSTVHVK